MGEEGWGCGRTRNRGRRKSRRGKRMEMVTADGGRAAEEDDDLY